MFQACPPPEFQAWYRPPHAPPLDVPGVVPPRPHAPATCDSGEMSKYIFPSEDGGVAWYPPPHAPPLDVPGMVSPPPLDVPGMVSPPPSDFQAWYPPLDVPGVVPPPRFGGLGLGTPAVPASRMTLHALRHIRPPARAPPAAQRRRANWLAPPPPPPPARPSHRAGGRAPSVPRLGSRHPRTAAAAHRDAPPPRRIDPEPLPWPRSTRPEVRSARACPPAAVHAAASPAGHGAAPPPTKLQACYRPPPPGSRRGSGSPRLPRPPGVSAAALVPPKSRELASARRGRARAAARSSTPPSGPPALPDVRDGESSAEDLSPREVTLQSASQPPGFLPGGRRQPAEVHGPRAYSYPTTTCGAKSPRSGTDSDLEAFSHNPADGSVAALPGQTAAKTNYLNQRFLSY
ncbi:hypothetical protein N7459_006342 [Penicillium hispanicum]|nr:hypothetical protein N7459_006342 [Penicillium hispanicum]